MATRLDTALASNAANLTYAISAGSNRRLLVGVCGEGTQSGAHTCDYGGQTGVLVGSAIAGSGTTQQTVSLFAFTETQIAAASNTTVSAGNVPTDYNLHAASYEDCEQGTLTNFDTDTSAAATPNPLAALDITPTDDNAIVAAVSGMGNAGSAAWAGVTEQTDQATASANGSFADLEQGTAAIVACECTWTTQNRAAAVAVAIEHLASVGITTVTPSEFDFDNASITIAGSGFGATIGASDVYLSPNDLLSEAGEVDITASVNTWSATSINLDLTTLGQAAIDLLHTMGPGARFVIVNVGGVPGTTEYFRAVTLHRPQAIEMVLSANFAPSVTTSRMTGLTGTFAGGRIEEAAAQNPSTTNTNVAADGHRVDVWNIQLKPNSREVSYDFRVLYGGVPAGTITQTPQLTLSAGEAVNLPSATVTLTANVPQAVATENNFSVLATATLTVTNNVPTVVATEHQYVTMATAVLTVVANVPAANASENNVTTLTGADIVLTGNAPSVEATEHHISQPPDAALVLTANAPQGVATEHHFSVLPSGTLTLTANVPQAITAQANFSTLAAATLTLTANVPQAVTTENKVSELATVTLTLTANVPTAETFDPNASQLATTTLTLTANVPQAVTTEGTFFPYHSIERRRRREMKTLCTM